MLVGILLNEQAQPDLDRLHKPEPDCIWKEEPNRYLKPRVRSGRQIRESDSSVNQKASKGLYW